MPPTFPISCIPLLLVSTPEFYQGVEFVINEANIIFREFLEASDAQKETIKVSYLFSFLRLPRTPFRKIIDPVYHNMHTVNPQLSPPWAYLQKNNFIVGAYSRGGGLFQSLKFSLRVEQIHMIHFPRKYIYRSTSISSQSHQYR